MFVSTAKGMRDYLKCKDFFKDVKVHKNKNKSFVFECEFDEKPTNLEESIIRAELEQYSTKFNYKKDNNEEKYLEIVILSGLIDNT